MYIFKERIKNLIKRTFFAFGFQISRYPNSDLKRRMKLIETHKINLIFDVGANKGQFSNNMRIWGFQGKIISFEPLSSAFNILKMLFGSEKNRILNNYALGEDNYKTEINISGNSVSSSIMNMDEKLTDLYPDTKYIDKETIEVKTLDSIFDEFCNKNDNIYLKIDTQGFEKNVLIGAKKSFDNIILIQLEMSMQKLYKEETTYIDMINFMNEIGFKLVSLEEGFGDYNTGYLLEFDAIFVNKKYELL